MPLGRVGAVAPLRVMMKATAPDRLHVDMCSDCPRPAAGEPDAQARTHTHASTHARTHAHAHARTRARARTRTHRRAHARTATDCRYLAYCVRDLYMPHRREAHEKLLHEVLGALCALQRCLFVLSPNARRGPVPSPSSARPPPLDSALACSAAPIATVTSHAGTNACSIPHRRRVSVVRSASIRIPRGRRLIVGTALGPALSGVAAAEDVHGAFRRRTAARCRVGRVRRAAVGHSGSRRAHAQPSLNGGWATAAPLVG